MIDPLHWPNSVHTNYYFPVKKLKPLIAIYAHPYVDRGTYIGICTYVLTYVQWVFSGIRNAVSRIRFPKPTFKKETERERCWEKEHSQTRNHYQLQVRMALMDLDLTSWSVPRILNNFPCCTLGQCNNLKRGQIESPKYIYLQYIF
jgi:hypothetical protein